MLASVIIISYLAFSLLMPLIVLILGSFSKLFGFFFIKDAWTTAHWLDALRDTRFLHAVVTSLVLGLSVGFLGTPIFSADRLGAGAIEDLGVALDRHPCRLPGRSPASCSASASSA